MSLANSGYIALDLHLGLHVIGTHSNPVVSDNFWAAGPAIYFNKPSWWILDLKPTNRGEAVAPPPHV